MGIAAAVSRDSPAALEQVLGPAGKTLRVRFDVVRNTC